jgi:leucyl aminopeptidase
MVAVLPRSAPQTTVTPRPGSLITAIRDAASGVPPEAADRPGPPTAAGVRSGPAPAGASPADAPAAEGAAAAGARSASAGAPGAGAVAAGAVVGGPVDVVAVPVARSATPGTGAREVAKAYGVDLDEVLAAERVTGKAGEVVRVPVLAPAGLPSRFLLIGTGDGGALALRRAAAALGRAVRGRKHLATTLGDHGGAESTRAVIEGLILGGYTPPTSGLRPRGEQTPVPQVTLVGAHRETAGGQGRAHARATFLARDLAETPSNVKNPPWLAERAAELGRGAGLDVQVWDVDRLRAEGFGGVLAVGSGSATPPRFVRLDYRPAGAAAKRRPVVLVGKGITYDTGGISIKPREAMVPMKTDMSGAAAVLAAVLACPALGVRRPVTALLPLAENAFGAASYRPGDVVTVHGGTTVEILNTDAEGRMVLADALAYAATQLNPDAIVDVATLTGAASQGLGRRHAALFASEDRLADSLLAAGAAAGEPAWRMPLVEDYRPALDSSIADLRHVPGRGRAFGGGSITAALFLREFVGAHRWAHLDIAGPARSDRDEHEVTRGATGYGARLLLRWLETLR